MAMIYTLWISRYIATARERIPGSIDNYVTGVNERSQQRGNLKDNGYKQQLKAALPCNRHLLHPSRLSWHSIRGTRGLSCFSRYPRVASK
ncbi:hypothetical protein [Photorhabdus laumondii]|nr:hypothetical protein [Photorhabdus laumondii]NDK93824.1 hypothetical protein [Photorhabdus laumondii subsp. laumondii]NDL46825.1 hypothetical protein [Photorhabdus laumondii subsp. laumondii]